MIGAIGNGLGNAWGQIKKATETTVEAVAAAAAAQNSTSTPAPTPTTDATEPTAPTTSPVVISAPVASEPLTYTASTGPRQVTASTASETPVRTTLGERLAQSSYYASPAASAVADPVASAQREKDGAALTQAQVIAQAAYSIVARAGVDDRMSLIRDS
ncbi:hypothetical protein [Sphingobium sp. WCS2017Hpa-17]|uniref:hypothetical protein n=1 Tax=Sphingobium sp. WCS2017Hpa-17 TaxID=3073638 RepID=UPI00288B2220|nr:hypothetical protein [Sphingobium sp. WCS2017Hpa-17]